MPFENLKHTKPDVTHLHVFGGGAYVFLLEEVRVNKLNPKSKLMTFLGYPQGLRVTSLWEDQIMCYLQLSKHYSMRHYSQNVHICIVPDILLQGEYNIPLEDNENGDDGGAPFRPALPGRHVPNQASLPFPPKTRAKVRTQIPWFCQNQPLQVRLLLSHRKTIPMFGHFV